MTDGTSSVGWASQSKYTFMKQCLNKWGFSSLIPIFEEQKIDDGLFICLESEQVQQLLPKEKYGIGIQWRFKKCHDALKDSVEILPLLDSRQNSPVISGLNESFAIDTVDRSGHVASAVAIGADFADLLDDDTFLAEETVSLSLENNEDKATQRSDSEGAQLSIVSEGTLNNKKRTLVDLTLADKHGLRQQAHRSICNLNLHSLLDSSFDGQVLLSAVKKNGGILRESDRTLLTDIVVKWLLFRIFDPTKIEYGILRDKILSEFPSESNVYYIPPREQGPRQALARGKLFDRVRNLKEWARQNYLLPEVGAKKRRSDEAAIASTSTAEEPLSIPEEVATALVYLKSHREDWTKIAEKWKLTTTHRMSKLQSDSEGGKLLDYMSEFKVLKQRQGYTLLEIDFKQLHPGKEEALFAEWNKLRGKLHQLLQIDAIKDRIGKHLVSCLPDCEKDDDKDIVVLQCLASLIPTTRMITIGKKKLKPSIDECRDAFILYVKLPADLSPAMSRRRQRIAKFGAGATLQPYLAFVGEERHTVNAVYVCIDTVVYKLDSVLQGLDVCFKSFFALNLKYPAEAEEVWLFLQQYVYGIKTSDDRSILKLTSFIGRLNAMDKKTKPSRKRR